MKQWDSEVLKLAYLLLLVQSAMQFYHFKKKKMVCYIFLSLVQHVLSKKFKHIQKFITFGIWFLVHTLSEHEALHPQASFSMNLQHPGQMVTGRVHWCLGQSYKHAQKFVKICHSTSSFICHCPWKCNNMIIAAAATHATVQALAFYHGAYAYCQGASWMKWYWSRCSCKFLHFSFYHCSTSIYYRTLKCAISLTRQHNIRSLVFKMVA